MPAPIRLRVDPTLDLDSRGTDVPTAAFGRADRLETRQTEDGVKTRLEGAAELRRGGTTMRADRIDYDDQKQTVTAEGAVTVERDGSRFVGPRMTLQLDSNQGQFEAPSYDLGVGGGRGKADRIELQGPGRFLLSNASFSTCRPDNEDWRIEARQLDIDENEGQGSGRNASLIFQDRRVLSLPVFYFPLGDERQSGFLTPSLSVTSRSGVEVTTPYYLNLAPNYDLTLLPVVSVRRGLQLGSQFQDGLLVATIEAASRVRARRLDIHLHSSEPHTLGIEQGWVSMRYGERQPAPRVRLEAHSRALRIATIIIPGQTGTDDTAVRWNPDAVWIRAATGAEYDVPLRDLAAWSQRT